MISRALQKIVGRTSRGFITPLDVTSVFLALLRENFSNKDNILTEELKDKIYSEEGDTKIVIESASVWDPLKAGIRPSILVARDQWAADPPYISSSRILETTPEKYVKTVTGAHQILCISRNYAEAELLGNEVFLILIHTGPVLIDYFPFQMFHVAGLSRVRPLDESKTHYMSAVSVRYSFNFAWEIMNPNKPPIRT